MVTLICYDKKAIRNFYEVVTNFSVTEHNFCLCTYAYSRHPKINKGFKLLMKMTIAYILKPTTIYFKLHIF